VGYSAASNKYLNQNKRILNIEDRNREGKEHSWVTEVETTPKKGRKGKEEKTESKGIV
jgi:hypothetical protein